MTWNHFLNPDLSAPVDMHQPAVPQAGPKPAQEEAQHTYLKDTRQQRKF